MASRQTSVGEGQNQNLSRKVKIFYDQHRNAQAGFPEGRAWWGYTEKQVDGSDAQPIGELSPVSADMTLADGTVIKGWSAPWVPEPKYVLMAVGGMSGPRFRIDYQRMQRDYEQASRDYYDRANNEAFSKGWPAIPLYGVVPYTIRALRHVGAPPKSPKIPEAAAAGDKWLLGFSREENEALARTLATDNGKLSHTPEAHEVPKAMPELDPALMAELLEVVRERRQAKVMREAKAAKKSTPENQAA